MEGITEFLPISSTGHLILANELISFEGEFANLFSIVIQTGAILSVVVYFFWDLIPKSTKKEDIRDFFSLWLKVAVGVFPAAVIGLSFEDQIDEYLFHPPVIAAALIIGGIWILLVDKDRSELGKVDNIKDMSFKLAFFIGLFQCLALIPGTSRSAMTIIGALMLGTTRKFAAEFSFYMAIPVLGGAGLVKLLKNQMGFTSEQWTLLGVGTFVSFLVALFVIAFLMNFIKKHNFRPFAFYRIVLGIAVIAWIAL